MTETVRLVVNDEEREVEVEARVTLADMLRESLRLTGTHLGCEHGVCGACTVLVDGLPVRSCLMLAVQAAGREVVTVEGLGSMDDLSLVQTSLWEAHAFQCGFCTPGFVVAATALLNEFDSPDEKSIREWLSGNICRCSGYETIVNGVLAAAAVRSEQRADKV